MAGGLKIKVPEKALADLCRRYHILRLSFFGSVLGDDFGGDSDIDVLVEFEPDKTPGLLGIARIEREASKLLGGRKVDLRTPAELSRYFKGEVISKARVQYASG